MSYFVPTRFVWRFGGRQVGCCSAHWLCAAVRRPCCVSTDTLPLPSPPQVHLCGSFTRWVETVPMAPVEGSPGVYAVVVHLPPG